MGCLNSGSGFEHWFANVHLSGPCNRRCYFCIGQHMMSLDPLNNLDKWPLAGFDQFIDRCRARGVREVNITGTNTEPLLYRHTPPLRRALEEALPGLCLGIRSNGVLALSRPRIWRLYDKASITVCSLDPQVYRQMMGRGLPPDVKRIVEGSGHMSSIKANVVLGPQNLAAGDVYRTLDGLKEAGIQRANLREPYGQPRQGDPLAAAGLEPAEIRLGMPVYDWDGIEACYWDVHFVEVESVNLYASGRVSELYPISRGHDPLRGQVKPQKEFPGGRIQEQWLKPGASA